MQSYRAYSAFRGLRYLTVILYSFCEGTCLLKQNSHVLYCTSLHEDRRNSTPPLFRQLLMQQYVLFYFTLVLVCVMSAILNTQKNIMASRDESPHYLSDVISGGSKEKQNNFKDERLQKLYFFNNFKMVKISCLEFQVTEIFTRKNLLH